MMKVKTKVITVVAVFTIIIAIVIAVKVINDVGSEEADLPENIVPSKETLIDNLENAGYTIENHSIMSPADSNIAGTRIVAKNKDRYIDICYGLDDENADEVFAIYEAEYGDTDYYILAQNGYYVYCVSDKKTFRKSGFSSKANIGIQYIRE
ncbi:MAG: hypothetical protein K2K56_10245 [Lachnospiraceae bacterium]|nr:hypothetical protein [Lachnospiraceae bacterium]